MVGKRYEYKMFRPPFATSLPIAMRADAVYKRSISVPLSMVTGIEAAMLGPWANTYVNGRRQQR